MVQLTSCGRLEVETRLEAYTVAPVLWHYTDTVSRLEVQQQVFSSTIMSCIKMLKGRKSRITALDTTLRTFIVHCLL